MQVPLCIKHIVGMSLLILFLGACAAPPTPAEGSLTITAEGLPSPVQTEETQPLATTPAQATETQPPTATPTQRPTIETLSLTPIAASPVTSHTLRLEKQMATQITLDETHIYWIGRKDPGYIFRYPLTGEGKIETVVGTQFEDGELKVMTPVRSGDWLIFFDTPRSAECITWALRALNLRDGTEQVLLEEPGDPVSWPGPLFDAEGDWVVWTRTSRSEEKNCSETILAMRNLRTGERRELERSCAEDKHMWVMPHISGDYLVVEQDLPDSKGRGNDVYLYDLASEQRVVLTDDRRSSFPDISGDWVVWRAASRFSFGRATALYNLRTGRQFKIRHEERQEGRLSGHWLYWEASVLDPLYVYDLETKQLLIVVTPGENEHIEEVAVYGDTVAWCRNLDFEHSAPHDTLLEWRTLP